MAFTVEDYQKIDLVTLKEYGFLSPVPSIIHLVFWNKLRLQKVGKVYVCFKLSDNDPEQGDMYVSGNLYGRTLQTIVAMERLPSNLGVGGGQWYFLCPSTGRRCQTLFFDGQRFVCRQAMAGKYYDCQMDSRPVKSVVNNIMRLKNYEKMRDEWLQKPRAKRYYRGKPTRMMKRFNKYKQLAIDATNHFKANGFN